MAEMSSVGSPLWSVPTVVAGAVLLGVALVAGVRAPASPTVNAARAVKATDSSSFDVTPTVTGVPLDTPWSWSVSRSSARDVPGVTTRWASLSGVEPVQALVSGPTPTTAPASTRAAALERGMCRT